jgi:uncharacterized membrane protein
VTVPGQNIVQAFGFNNHGQTMVTTETTSGTYRHGVFTPLPAPPAGMIVTGTGINDAGVITGTAFPSDFSAENGFILDGSTYTFFSRPGWESTEPRGIDNLGRITGLSFNDGTIVDGAGFLFDPRTGVFTDVTPPGSDTTIAQGSNAAGKVSGNGRRGGQPRFAFIEQGGTFTEFQVADGQSNARGINDADFVAGFALSGGKNVGFVGSLTTGFDLLAGPGDNALGTVCEGINNARQVICTSTDTAGVAHAFIASLPEAALASLLDAVTDVGPGHSLEGKVMAAQTAFAGGNVTSTCALLGALLKEVTVLASAIGCR